LDRKEVNILDDLISTVLNIYEVIKSNFPVIVDIVSTFGVGFSIYLGIKSLKSQKNNKRLDLKPYLNIITDNSKENKSVPNNHIPKIHIVTKNYSEKYDENSDFIYYPIFINNIGVGNAIKIRVDKIYLEHESKKYHLETLPKKELFDYVDLNNERAFTLAHPYETPIIVNDFERYVIVFLFEDMVGNQYKQTIKYPTILTKDHSIYKGSFYGGWGSIEVTTKPPLLD